MELKGKMVLKEKGDSSSLQLKQKNASIVHAKLSWTKAVDLDLHAFYKTKEGKFGHISFSNKGGLDKEPFIMLDEDAGVGNTAGDNEENIRITQLDKLDSVLIATNIFKFFGFLSKGANFGDYDGKVVVTTDGGDNIEVPLTSKNVGKWCIIAKLDNTGPLPKLININTVQKDEPDGKSI
jgi:tellurite resistance protein TerA